MQSHSLADGASVWGTVGPPLRPLSDGLTPEEAAEAERLAKHIGGLADRWMADAEALRRFQEKQYYVWWLCRSWTEFARRILGKDPAALTRTIRATLGQTRAYHMGIGSNVSKKRSGEGDPPEGAVRPAEVKQLPDAEPVPEEPTAAVVERDKIGVPIPDFLLDEFKIWEQIEAVCDEVNFLEAKLMKLAMSPGGAWMEEASSIYTPSKRADKSLARVDCQIARAIRTELFENGPYTRCPFCIDEVLAGKRKTCTGCKQLRWVPKRIFLGAPQVDQQKVRRLAHAQTETLPEAGAGPDVQGVGARGEGVVGPGHGLGKDDHRVRTDGPKDGAVTFPRPHE